MRRLLSVYIRRDFPSIGLYRSFLDTARIGLMPSVVRDEGVRRFIEFSSDPLAKVQDVGWKYEYFKRGLARLMLAERASNVTVMGSTTSCITRMVGSIVKHLYGEYKEKVRVAATIHEYPGVILSLRTLCRSLKPICGMVEIVGLPGEPSWEDQAVEFFERGPGVLVASSVMWVTGYVPKLDTVARAARNNGGYLVVDMAQQLGHLMVNPVEKSLDVMCGTTKKWLLNPLSSMGIAYISDRVVNNVDPYIVGLHNVEPQELMHCDPDGPNVDGLVLKASADRFMSISRPSLFSIDISNIIISYILNISMGAIQDHVLALRKVAEDMMYDAGFNVTLKDADYERKSGILLVNLGLNASKHYEICKQLSKRGIAVSCRGQAGFHGIRVSIHIYNNEEDIQVFIDEARKLVKRYGS